MSCPYITTEDIFTCTVKDLYMPSLVEMEWYCLDKGKRYRACPFFVPAAKSERPTGMRTVTEPHNNLSAAVCSGDSGAGVGSAAAGS
ncbi:MAG: hypothetical protein AB1442_00515 [Nitrospirota bacterium]